MTNKYRCGNIQIQTCRKEVNKNQMKYTNKLKMAMIATNINQVKLAELTNQSQQNLSQKMVSNSYRIQEYERLINAMGC